MKYTKVKDNEWIQPIKNGYKMQCCDCGLVHDMDFRVHDGKIQFRPKRNNRSTNAIRRNKDIAIFKGTKK